MLEERKKELAKELQYLISSEINKEIDINQESLNDTQKSVKDIAKEIYLKRGVDYNKINNNISSSFGNLSNILSNQNKNTKKKMIMDIVYIAIILLLIKIPFNLVRDIGYDYIELLSKSNLYYNLWNLLILLLYTITLISCILLFIRNFKNKYCK